MLLLPVQMFLSYCTWFLGEFRPLGGSAQHIYILLTETLSTKMPWSCMFDYKNSDPCCIKLLLAWTVYISDEANALWTVLQQLAGCLRKWNPDCRMSRCGSNVGRNCFLHSYNNSILLNLTMTALNWRLRLSYLSSSLFESAMCVLMDE